MTELLECADMMSMNCPGDQGKKIDANRPLLKLLVEGACSPGKTFYLETDYFIMI